jgi:SAM-dependent methyltransferase
MFCQDFLKVHENEQTLIDQLITHLPQNLSVLDLGTGVGRHLEFLRQRRPRARLVGVESDPNLHEFCVERLGPVVVRTEEELPLGQRYDLVLMMGNGLGMWGREEKAVAGLRRAVELLHPAGVVVAEASPLGPRGYNTHHLTNSYGGLQDPPFEWGFATFEWADSALKNLGLKDIGHHPAHHAQAFIISGRKPGLAGVDVTAGSEAQPVPHDSWAAVYDEAYEAIYGAAYDSLTKVTLDVIRTLVAPKADILDLGAGTGRLSIPLAQGLFQVTAIERSQPMLDRLVQKARSAGVAVQTQCRPIEDFQVATQQDLLVCVFTVLNYLTTQGNLRGFAECCATACQNTGKLLLSFAPDLDMFSRALARMPRLPHETPTGATVTRQPAIRRLGNRLYKYSEWIGYDRQGATRHFRDEFNLRQWSREEVLGAMGSFRLEQDLSAQFAETGESYLLLAKSRE